MSQGLRERYASVSKDIFAIPNRFPRRLNFARFQRVANQIEFWSLRARPAQLIFPIVSGGDALQAEGPRAEPEDARTRIVLFSENIFYRKEFVQGAHGVVVSHPLRMRKALGSNPSVSMAVIFSKRPTNHDRRIISTSLVVTSH